MSRVGKLPIALSENINVVVDGDLIKISGPKGELTRSIDKVIKVDVSVSQLQVTPRVITKFARSMWGTSRNIINNMVSGVTTGFKKELEVVGIGYRVALKGNVINFALGKSHSVKVFIPEGLVVSLPKQNHIVVEGIDKEQIGQFVSMLMKQKPTEPFKGKGIKPKDQLVKLKEGKKN